MNWIDPFWVGAREHAGGVDLPGLAVAAGGWDALMACSAGQLVELGVAPQVAGRWLQADPEQTLYEFAAPPGSMHRGEPVPWHAQRAGSLVHLNAVTVGVAVEAWLSILRGETGSVWQRLTWDATGHLTWDAAAVSSDPECPFCGRPETGAARAG